MFTRENWTALEADVRPFIFTIAAKLTHDPELAADLTQDTLLTMHSQLDRFDPARPFRDANTERERNPAHLFRAWAKTIVTRKFLDHVRKGRNREMPFTSAIGRGIEVDMEAEKHGYCLQEMQRELTSYDREEFNQFLKTLTYKQLQVARLLVKEAPTTQSAIAERLNITQQAVSKIIANLRRAYVAYFCLEGNRNFSIS